MTPYQNIFERFVGKVKDYVLDDLFCSSITSFDQYLLGWLKSAIPKFRKCKSDLSNRNDQTFTFNSTLTELEEEILSMMMVVEWSEKEVKNVLDMRLTLSNSDFKRYAESQNLKAKLDLQNQLLERVDRLIVEYTYDDFSFG